MKFFIATLSFLPPIILCTGAVYLAANQIDGWGWFLLCAVLVKASVSYSENSDDESKQTNHNIE